MKKPICLSIVGKKGVGRSDFIKNIAMYLSNKDYKVGVVKHLAREDIEIDQPGKDTYKYRMGGANKVILSGKKRCAIYENRESFYAVKELLSHFQNYDYVIFENYYDLDLPIFESGKKEEIMDYLKSSRLQLC